MNSMRRKGKKYIRHPKSDPKIVRDDEKIIFRDFLINIKLDSKRYEEILRILLLNKIKEKPVLHISKFLKEEDYLYMKEIVYTLATLAFRFIDIHYLFLKLFGSGKPQEWSWEYSKTLGEKTFLQKPVRIEIYRDEKRVQGLYDIFIEKSKIQSPDEKKQEERLKNIIDTVMKQKVSITHLDTTEILSIKELMELEKKDRRK